LLNESNVPFFSRLRETCQNIGSGELVRYDYNGIVGSGFEYIVTSLTPTGAIPSGSAGAAERILRFLADNPDHWPK
jgi:hypothetical protein